MQKSQYIKNHQGDDENIILDIQEQEKFEINDQKDNQQGQSLGQQDDKKIEQEADFDFNINTTWFTRLFLVDLIKIISYYSKLLRKFGKLSVTDLPRLQKSEDSEYLSNIFINNLSKLDLQKLTPKDMVIQLFKPVKVILIISFLCCVAYNICSLTLSILIEQLLDSIYNYNRTSIYIYASVLCFLILLQQLLGNIRNKYSNVACLYIRIMTMVTLYKKINSLTQFAVKEANIGKLVNLVSNDFNNVESKMFPFILVPTLPISLIYCFIILIIRFSWLGIISALLTILSCIISIIVSKKFAEKAKIRAQYNDQRVKLCNEIIEGIRLIKMYAWEDVFKQLAKVIRMKELGEFVKMQIFNFLSHSFNYSATHLILFIQLIAIHYYSHDLTTSKIFATVQLLTALRQQILMGGFGIFCYREFQIIGQRILEILKMNNTEMQNIEQDNNNNKEIQINKEKIDIYFNNFFAYWNFKQSQMTNPKQPVLKNINLEIQKGTFLCVVGKIGSGKSSLISCILKEVPLYSGQFYSNSKIAIVEQEPYIFNGTVKDNIIFGKQFDQAKYDYLVNICCLQQDFNELPNSDMTEIGERGINISGGQKARISLARAVYSDAELYLFDDPLSAVDSQVGRNIFNDVMKGYLKMKTIVLITHQIQYTKEVDKIIILDQGEIKSVGTFLQLENELQQIIGQQKFEQNNDNNLQIEQQFELIQNQLYQTKINLNISNVVQKNNNNEEKGKLTNLESEENNNISFNTYSRYYSSSNSMLIWFITLILFITPEVIFIYYTKYLGQYEKPFINYEKQEKHIVYDTEIKDKLMNEQLNTLIMVLILALIYFFNMLIKYRVLISAHVRSVSNMHDKMMKSILHSKVLYFDQTPSGRILNAFSNDTGIVDGSVLHCQGDVYEIIIGFIVMMSAAIDLNAWISIAIACECMLLVSYLKYSQQIIINSRKLDLNNKSPIFTFFNTTIGGVLPIKIYNLSETYVKKYIKIVNTSCKASILFVYCARGFAFTLNILCSFCSALCIFIVISAGNSSTNSESIGKILIYLLYITDSLQFGLRQKIQLDIGLSSAQRNYHLQDIPQEPPIVKQNDEILKIINFPEQGELHFKNIQFRYREKLDLVLKQVNFKINAKEKVGCIGRTGSGKSSLLQVLFRMYEIEVNEGSGIFIDDYNISEYGLHLIRNSISILPQIPFVFSGTIRRNLDPLQIYSDQQLWDVLEKTDLKSFVEQLKDQLNTDMTQVSSIFSVGQKQLICLCRAILKKSKILVLDEATANIDMKTDEFIQKQIKLLFKDCTVFTIAHRLNTIADYDKVLVMDSGQVVEYDIPYLLLVKNIEDNEITNNKGLFAKLVLKSGEKNSKHIFEIAKNKYFSKKN